MSNTNYEQYQFQYELISVSTIQQKEIHLPYADFKCVEKVVVLVIAVLLCVSQLFSHLKLPHVFTWHKHSSSNSLIFKLDFKLLWK